jgi:hypothetical protein
MKRLIQAKPRTKKKEVVMTIKFTFEAVNDNEDEAKNDIKRFKDWMKNQFTEWDTSILEYFLYAYKLSQDDDDSKYILDVHIDKILKDDSATIDEREHFQKMIDDENEKNEDEIEEQEDDIEENFSDHVIDEDDEGLE